MSKNNTNLSWDEVLRIRSQLGDKSDLALIESFFHYLLILTREIKRYSSTFAHSEPAKIEYLLGVFDYHDKGYISILRKEWGIELYDMHFDFDIEFSSIYDAVSEGIEILHKVIPTEYEEEEMSDLQQIENLINNRVNEVSNNYRRRVLNR